MDLKFAMVNVQGLSGKCTNKLELVEIRDLFRNNDVVLFTETWGSEYTNFNVCDFTHYELNRTEIKANSKRASGGIIIYIKTSLIKQGIDMDLGVKKFGDDIMWLSLTKDFFYVNCDFHLCLCYNVPSGSSREAMVDMNMFDRLTEQVANLKAAVGENSNIIICGDLNARIADLKDYVTEDDARHIYSLPDDYVSDKELPRKSKDTAVNANGRLLLDFCKGTGFRIANGRVGHGGNVGECTYVGRNGSSLIDYVLVSQNVLDMFSSFYIDDPNIFSDHCVINFSMSDKILY